MKTIYFIGLQTANTSGYQHTILPNTTLNEYHDVGSPIPNNNPIMNFFVMGLKTVGDELDGTAINLGGSKHTPKDGNVYSPIPFRFMPLDMDIAGAERSKYRLRKQLQINGEEYVAYYMKELDNVNVGRYLVGTNNGDGGLTIEVFNSIDSTILNPMPAIINLLDISDNTLRTLAYTKPYKMPLTTVELYEMREATAILYGSDRAPIIGEYLMTSGDDKTDFYGNVESNGVQASIFIDVDIDIDSVKDNGITHVFEVGGMELMLVSTE